MDDSHEYVPPLAYAPPGARPARAELETLAVSPARFGQLAVYVAACVMTAINWNIVVRRACRVGCDAQHACSDSSPLTGGEKAPVYAIAEARFDVGVQQVNSLSNVRVSRRTLRVRAPRPVWWVAASREPAFGTAH